MVNINLIISNLLLMLLRIFLRLRSSDRPSASLDNNDALSVSHFSIKSVDEIAVLLALKKLKLNITAGPDLIPSFLLKDCAIVRSRPVKVIFNLILETAVFPELWKESKVTLIFKGGDRADVYLIH